MTHNILIILHIFCFVSALPIFLLIDGDIDMFVFLGLCVCRYGAVVRDKIEKYKRMREELSSLRSTLNTPCSTCSQCVRVVCVCVNV